MGINIRGEGASQAEDAQAAPPGTAFPRAAL